MGRHFKGDSEQPSEQASRQSDGAQQSPRSGQTSDPAAQRSSAEARQRAIRARKTGELNRTSDTFLDVKEGESVTTTEDARNYYGSAPVKASKSKDTAGYQKVIPSYHASGSTVRGRVDTSQREEALAAAKKKKASRSRVISNILIGVGIILLLVAGGMWAYTQWQYAQQDAENAKLAEFATVSDDGSTAPVVDWAALKAINADVVGWIQIPGTVVDYPVYQGSDNDHYLNTNAEGVYGVGGQIFMDYQNTAPGLVDEQTIVYGHHLKNGAMFKQVADMDNQEFFNSIHTVWYVTEDATYELEPLFVYYTNPDDTNVRVFSWPSQDEYHAYLNGLLSKSVSSTADASAIIGGTSRVLTLSTCNYISGYGRTILVCVQKSEANAVLNPATGG